MINSFFLLLQGERKLYYLLNINKYLLIIVGGRKLYYFRQNGKILLLFNNKLISQIFFSI